jgi:TRAP-type mannitol/chloroaromatic compound transport system permease small subunit
MVKPSGKLWTMVNMIDTVSEWSGKIVRWLILPLVFGSTYEVIARYAFKSPTIWAYDLSYMLYGTIFMLGAAYTLRQRAHIRTDIFYEKWSPRRQGWVDAILYLFFFFPGIIFFLIAGWDEAAHSWSILEKSEASPWRPPLYPFKTVIPVTAFLLLLQGVSEFVKSLYAGIKGERP